MTSIQPAAVTSVTPRFREYADTPRVGRTDRQPGRARFARRRPIPFPAASDRAAARRIGASGPGGEQPGAWRRENGDHAEPGRRPGPILRRAGARHRRRSATARASAAISASVRRLPGLTEAAADSSLGLSRVDAAVRRIQSLGRARGPTDEYTIRAAQFSTARSTRRRRTPPLRLRADRHTARRAAPRLPAHRTLVDGFLIVVAAHKTPRKTLAEALNTIDPRRVIGLVFNADDRPSADYYGYYYRSDSRTATSWWRRLARSLSPLFLRTEQPSPTAVISTLLLCSFWRSLSRSSSSSRSGSGRSSSARRRWRGSSCRRCGGQADGRT